jgi:hypothetical protein
MEVINSEVVAPQKHNPAVPRDLELICLKALKKEPERRYKLAATLADDLGRFLGGAPVAARRSGAPEPLSIGWWELAATLVTLGYFLGINGRNAVSEWPTMLVSVCSVGTTVYAVRTFLRWTSRSRAYLAIAILAFVGLVLFSVGLMLFVEWQYGIKRPFW